MLNQIRHFMDYHIRYSPIYKKKLKEVLSQKEMSNAEQLEIQNQKFLQLFDVAISKSTFYQKLYAEYGIGKHDIKSVEDISKLPVITKSKIRDCIDDIYIGNPLLKAKGYTSGTSGSPLVIYRSYQSIVEEQASIWAWRSGFGYLPGLKTVSLRGDLGRDEMMRHDKVANVLYLSSYNIKKENANWYYNQIKDFSPYAIIAYPSSVDNLANILLSIDKRLNVPYVFTASEMLYDNQRSKISNAFQTQVFDRYGNAERTIAIEQRSDGSYYESPCYSVNEYQEDCTITTSLIDNSFPLIRYKVTDIIQPSKYTSTEDANRFKIDKIIGRDDDVLLMPDGTKVGRLDVVLKGINHLEYAQFIQEQPDSFILNLVVTPDFSAEDEKKIVANLQYRLGGNMRYELRKVKEEDIIISKSGKFKLVINRIKELDLTL